MVCERREEATSCRPTPGLYLHDILYTNCQTAGYGVLTVAMEVVKVVTKEDVQDAVLDEVENRNPVARPPVHK